MKSPLRILLLEDDPSDAELIQALLEADHCISDFTRVETRAEFLTALETNEIDLILADYKLPSFDGISALKLAQSARPDLPFIFVSGTLGEEVAIEALKLGATDYVLKTRLARLVPSVHRALREAEERAELKKAEEALRASDAFLAAVADERDHALSKLYEAVSRSEMKLRDVIETIPTFAWTALPDGSVEFVNRHGREYAGLSAEDSPGPGWQAAVHPDDLRHHADNWLASLSTGTPFNSELRYRRAADGQYRWFLSRAVPLRDEQGKIVQWYGISTDIDDRKHAETFLAGEKRVLQMVARNESLAQILECLCRLAEDNAPDVLASVLLIEDGRLIHGGAPSLPRAYIEAIDGVAIGPAVGSCGTAAYFAKQIIVSDIATDPLWANYRDAALPHSLRACWSTPIMSSEGKVIGTFAMYYREARRPSQADQEIIEQITHLAGVAIQSKLAAEALRASEARFRTFVDHATDAFMLHSEDGTVVDANRQACESLGYSRDELIGMRPTDFDPDVNAAQVQSLNERLNAGEIVTFESRHRRKDGTVFPIEFRARAFRQGGRRFSISLTRDITERKRAEHALRQSEEQWKAVFENNPTMYFMVDASGTIVSVNPFGAEQLGYRTEELMGRPVENLVHEADRKDAEVNMAICLERLGRAMSWELRKIRKDGEVLWVRETARAMLIKERPVVLIACEDITGSRRAEYLTGQVFESYPEPMGVVGRDYRFKRVNRAYERIWAMPPETIVGKHLADLFGTKFFEQTLKPNYDRCFAGEEVRYEEWFSYPRGRRYLEVSYSPLRPDSDRVEAALLVTRDLTDHVLSAEALRKVQSELAHVNRVSTMGQLTASIAHEVNQPITGVITNAEVALHWLSTHTPDLNKVRELLGHIVSDGVRAGEVIGRIRDLIKKAPPRKARFDLSEAVREVITVTRSEVLRHDVSLETQLAADSMLEGDRVQLQQVILNLILNAVEAMSSNDEGARKLLISTEREALGDVLVTVRDTGPGLNPQSVDRLFEAFYTTKPEGMGMGLTICRSIIEAHGGRLWATANEPRGAVFQFTIPPGQDETNAGVRLPARSSSSVNVRRTAST